jgi:predicted RNA methylase
LLEVNAGSNISPLNFGFAPAVSVTNMRHTFNADIPVVACELVNTILLINEPFAPAVKRVTSAPDPSLDVLAAAMVALAQLGVNVKMGDVFAAII